MKKYIKYFAGGLITAVLGVFAISLLGPTTSIHAYIKCTPISTAPGTAGQATGTPYYVEDGEACFTGGGTASEEHPGEPIPSGSNTNSPSNNANSNNNGSSSSADDDCDVGSLGWILCPGRDLITDAVDNFMGAIDSQLAWDFGDELIDLWTNFLPIANIAFAIVFLIVIYSTATGVGLNNYSVKKIMPRLIIVAVAVNVSFYICVALVDLSNIIGSGIEGIFPDIGNKNVVADTISGITSAVALIVLTIAFSGTALLSLLIIFLALAARYVVLFLLVAISPLAIVCALLPQTEKWFKKWLNTYIQLLVVYPIFALAWHGIRWIQGQYILGEAGLLGWIISMALPIAPLFVIIPAMKFGGGLMGKMTGAIQKGVQSSPLGSVAKNWDDANRNVAKNALHNASQFKDLEKPTVEGAQESRDEQLLALAKKNGLKDKDGNDFTNAKDAKDALIGASKENESLLGVMDKINDGYESSIKGLDAKTNQENMAFNKENAEKIESRRRMNRMRRTGARILTGEAGEDRAKRAKELYDTGRQGRVSDVNKELFNKDTELKNQMDNLQRDESGNLKEDGEGNYIGKDGTKIPKNYLTRQRMGSAFQAAGVEDAKLKADTAESQYKNAVEEQKLSGRASGTGVDGRLFNSQAELNAASRNSDTLAAALKSDVEQQKSEDIVNLNKTREAENDTTIFTNQQKEFVSKANEADVAYVEKIRKPAQEKREKALEEYQKVLEKAQENDPGYKQAKAEFDSAGTEQVEANAKLTKLEQEKAGLTDEAKIAAKETEITNAKQELEAANREKSEKQNNLESISKQIEGSAEVVSAKNNIINTATAELAQTEEALKDNRMFQMIDSSQNVKAAEASYEAAKGRAEQGLTSTINLQKAAQAKDLADARLETDKSTRLAQDEEMQSVDRQIRATKERTVNVNRAVNVDYATKIQDDPTLATYAGGGGVTDVNGTLRQSDEISNILAQGAAVKTVDSDVGDKNANIVSFVDNNPKEWQNVADIVRKDGNVSAYMSIAEQQAKIQQHDNVAKMIFDLTSDKKIMSDPDKTEIIYGKGLSGDIPKTNPYFSTYLQFLAGETKDARKEDRAVNYGSFKEALSDPKMFAKLTKNIDSGKLTNMEYDELHEMIERGGPEAAANIREHIASYSGPMTTGNKSLADNVYLDVIFAANTPDNPGGGQKMLRRTGTAAVQAKLKVNEYRAFLGLPDDNGKVTKFPPKNKGKKRAFEINPGNQDDTLEMIKMDQISEQYKDDPTVKKFIDESVINLNSKSPVEYEAGVIDLQKEVAKAAGFEYIDGEWIRPEEIEVKPQKS